ncbi:hypothetical protein CERZMDRAFT_95587 [Cercospora zeae-maydis SCOH1-5]|uniref:Uncharacterized protein n=1 Tax=Cercospora zeae-maydis SCOH1-5 TaxID=717836 RepID=A0A6A6FLQ5_9PEZI|nr:hypothetical protein CERZMDRAFT_95587 [Cercospora zeae-maydis SCOH1-5]
MTLAIAESGSFPPVTSTELTRLVRSHSARSPTYSITFVAALLDMASNSSNMARNKLIHVASIESSKSVEEHQRLDEAANALLELANSGHSLAPAPPPYSSTVAHYSTAGALRSPFLPLAPTGTKTHPTDPDEDVETASGAPILPLSIRPAGQDLHSWNNEFLLGKNSMPQIFQVGSIHPDDLGGKLFAILKDVPHTVATNKIIMETLDCYARHGLPRPTRRAVHKRVKDALKFWDGKPGAASGPNAYPPPYAPPQHALAVTAQPMPPPTRQVAPSPPPAFEPTVESHIRDLTAANAILRRQNENWEAANRAQKKVIQGLRTQLAAANERLRGLPSRLGPS